MNENDILHESGDFWVGRTRNPSSYTVYRNTTTHAVPDSSYELSEDGLRIARARCDYLATRFS